MILKEFSAGICESDHFEISGIGVKSWYLNLSHVFLVQRQVLNGQELLLDKLQEIRKVCGVVLLVLGIWKTLKVMCLYKHSTRRKSLAVLHSCSKKKNLESRK